MTPSDNNNFKQHFTVYNFLSMAKNYFQKILVLLVFFFLSDSRKQVHSFFLACFFFLSKRKKQAEKCLF